jgi:hypothetical protein
VVVAVRRNVIIFMTALLAKVFEELMGAFRKFYRALTTLYTPYMEGIQTCKTI